MINYSELLNKKPFGMTGTEKRTWYFELQRLLTEHHYENCEPYRKFIDRLSFKPGNEGCLADLPFISVRLFKSHTMQSTEPEDIIRTLNSSGTSGKGASTIHLDKKAVFLQSKVLRHILSDFIPSKRVRTMFVINEKTSGVDKEAITASIAATRGFAQFAETTVSLIDQDDTVNIEPLMSYVEQFPNEPFMIFGFTSTVWFKLIGQLDQNRKKLEKNSGILIHGGGWKKMQSQAVDKSLFKTRAKRVLGVDAVHDYYGMVEQTGSVFVECSEGFFHPSIYSEIIIRNSKLEQAELREVGLVQVMSLLAESYPGHNILTDDLGIMHGEDNCKCGRLGKFFSVLGRISGVETRGCSDAS
ncbi:acyl-protein synthetase [Alphaproteobacteria bacterium]|nr:acyl-protein synthetase [Alphaproteobacteria bacterium]